MKSDTPWWPSILLVFVVLGLLWGYQLLVMHAQSSCEGSDVMYSIVSSERPRMGPLERVYWVKAVSNAAIKHKASPVVFMALVAKESHFRGRAVGSRGEIGATQLMPMHTNGIDPYEIEDNLDKGAELLGKAITDTGSIGDGLRVYNGGPNGINLESTKNYRDAVLNKAMQAAMRVCKPLKSLEQL